MDIRSLLLVRADRVGDLMHVTPLLRALREQRPGMAVDVLGRAPATAVLEGNPGVRRVLDARWDDATLAAALAEGGYDAVAHLFPERRLIALCRFIPRSVRKGWFPWPGRHRRVPLHRSRSAKSESLYNADLLLPWFPDLSVDPRPELFVGGQARARAAELMPTPRVLLNPGSGHPEGAWPAARFREVARLLAPTLGPALVVWGPGEEGLAREVTASGHAEVAPPTDLLTLAALAERCRVFVTNDTGPMHLAAAAGAPMVVVWEGSRVIRPLRWGHHFRADILNIDPFDGTGQSPEERRRRLERVGPEQVAEAALELLRETSAGGSQEAR